MQNRINKIRLITTEEHKTVQRDFMVVRGYAFYQSSGTSSAYPNILFPCFGLDSNPLNASQKDLVIKPFMAYSSAFGAADEEKPSNWFGEDETLLDFLNQ